MKLHKNIAEGILQGIESVLKNEKALRTTLSLLLKQNRKWGSRDRRFLGEGILEIVRWKRLYEWMGQLDPKSENYYWNLIGVWIVSKNRELPDWNVFYEIKNLKLQPEDANLPLAVKESIPDWLNELGLSTFSKEEWEKEILSLNGSAPLFLRVNTLKTTSKKLQVVLKKEHNITAHPKSDVANALMIEVHQKLDHLDIFKKGLFEIQDINSQRVSLFASPKPGDLVIDVCAGAGGKTLHMAALMENKGEIIAVDPYEKKLEQLEKRAQRNGVKIVHTFKDQTNFKVANFKNRANLVLIDAPCSGLGVLRRNPAAKWHMNPNRIKELVMLQQQILQKNAELVAPGGSIVYATCTLFPAENQEQIQTFLKSKLGIDFTLEKELSLLSNQTEGDGFYMAKLTKKATSN
ncbi:MAG: RsmB/NOP family class I SAM-dependent RNA methyltransferase [Flavobacteriaceae bacterium]